MMNSVFNDLDSGGDRGAREDVWRKESQRSRACQQSARGSHRCGDFRDPRESWLGIQMPVTARGTLDASPLVWRNTTA
jgi:hypothetical protein